MRSAPVQSVPGHLLMLADSRQSLAQSRSQQGDCSVVAPLLVLLMLLAGRLL